MSNEAKKVWTRGEIEDMLRTNDRAVERAMVAIWERQTGDEQATQTAAQDALNEMMRIHAYTAPEVNGGLTKRLGQAKVVPTTGVTGIEFEVL